MDKASNTRKQETQSKPLESDPKSFRFRAGVVLVLVGVLYSILERQPTAGLSERRKKEHASSVGLGFVGGSL